MMFVFDGKMLRFPVGKNHMVELDVVYNKQTLYIGAFWKKSPNTTHIWVSFIPTIQIRLSILKKLG